MSIMFIDYALCICTKQIENLNILKILHTSFLKGTPPKKITPKLHTVFEVRGAGHHIGLCEPKKVVIFKLKCGIFA